MDLLEAAARLEKFQGGSLTRELAHLETLLLGEPPQEVLTVLSARGIDPRLLASAGIVKRASGQIDTIVHAVGILLSLPRILQPAETIQSLSLGAGNTGREFDLETDQRIAEFKFMRWRGGSESIRQNVLFKDFFALAEADTDKERYLYVLGLERPMKFLTGGRALRSVLSRNNPLLRAFQERYGDRFTRVREYYEFQKDRVRVVDLLAVVPEIHLALQSGASQE